MQNETPAFRLLLGQIPARKMLVYKENNTISTFPDFFSNFLGL
jgi:hypothetical protein